MQKSGLRFPSPRSGRAGQSVPGPALRWPLAFCPVVVGNVASAVIDPLCSVQNNGAFTLLAVLKEVAYCRTKDGEGLATHVEIFTANSR